MGGCASRYVHTHSPIVTEEIDLAATRACHCLAARKAARAITRHFDEYLRPHGLRSTQFSVLAALSQMGPTPVSDLAEVLGLERTTLSRSASLLERNGWVETAPSEDARERRLVLTESGLGRLKEALPAWARAQQRVDEGRVAGLEGSPILTNN